MEKRFVGSWRDLILVNRATRINISNPAKVPVERPVPQDYTKKNSLDAAEVYVSSDYTKNNTSRIEAKSRYSSNTTHNQIIIINTNVSPVMSIALQNRPSSMQVNPMSYWVSVKSMGRNNPFMMYTGGEDSIQLEVSWFVNDPNNRSEVLTKCRLLESWSRADGYMASPPTLKISWGSSGIFDNDLFILESAPYELSNFQSFSGEVKSGSSNLSIREIGLLPQCATQTLTFKRVTPGNRTHADIVSMADLEKTNGIKIE